MSFINEYDHVLNAEKTIIRYCFEIRKLADNLPIEFRNELNRDIDLLINDQSYLLELELKLHSEFSEIYKNGYKHSSWLSLMDNRIANSISHLAGDGLMQVAIDDQEYRYLNLLLFNFSIDRIN